MKICLIKYKKENKNFLDKIIDEFEKTIIQTNNVFVKEKKSSGIIYYKILNYIILRMPKLNFGKSNSIYQNFTIGMGPDFAKLLPFSILNNNNNIYLFDSWPQYYYIIEKAIKVYNIRNVFFSSIQVTNRFKKIISECNFSYIPEAINPEEYQFKEYSEKDIDILQFGRKYDKYHIAIYSHTIKKSYIYLFEKVKGEIIFPNHTDFINGLASTKISICVPSNITHPERSGDISTMTVRYLQSMASKCLILGVLPEEMKTLFDYNPIIEIDFENPLSQIDEILNNYENYFPLIEKNYNEVLQKHTWRNRWESIQEILNK